MTFVLQQKPTFTAPVAFSIPADGGKTQKVAFSVVFKMLSASEYKELNSRIALSNANHAALVEKLVAEQKERAGAPLTAIPQPECTDRDTIDIVLAGFGPDLLDEDKTPLEFNQVNLDRLLEIHGCAGAIVSSFFKHYAEQPAKN